MFDRDFTPIYKHLIAERDRAEMTLAHFHGMYKRKQTAERYEDWMWALDMLNDVERRVMKARDEGMMYMKTQVEPGT
jgi:hypothetical protein